MRYATDDVSCPISGVVAAPLAGFSSVGIGSPASNDAAVVSDRDAKIMLFRDLRRK